MAALLVVAVLVVGAVGAVVAVGAGPAWWTAGDGAGPSDPGVPAAPAAGQALDVGRGTLLVQLAADEVALASALTGTRATSASSAASASPSAATQGLAGSVVLVPSRLVVDTVGAGSMPFGDALALASPTASADALTDLLGVRVDGALVLTSDGLAGLVDAVGGVEVHVDTDVLVAAPGGGDAIVVPAGEQRLAGAAAAAVASYAELGEPEQSRLARFNQVLVDALSRLPEGTSAVADVVAGLGEGARTTLELDQVAARLDGLRAALAADAVSVGILPVHAIETGGEVQTLGLDAPEAAGLVAARFPGALLSTGPDGPVRVLVQNGVGTPGLGAQARELLVAAGYRFAAGGNAASFDVEQTVVLVPDAGEQARAMGERVAETLGLGPGSVRTSSRGQTTADVIVILGRDFQP